MFLLSMCIGLYLGIGIIWFVSHFNRVRRHDLMRESPAGDFRLWEWPMVFALTVTIWPVAIWYYIDGREERA